MHSDNEMVYLRDVVETLIYMTDEDSDGVEEVMQLPTIELPTWIPCSERLPQIGQKVLASTKKTVFTQVFKGYYSEPNQWAWENNSVKTIEAWMPLPQPWKGVDDE